MPTLLLVTIFSIADAFVSATQQQKPQASKSPFAGSGSADLSQSRLDPKLPLKGAEIIISVNGNIVTVASSLIIANGQTVQEWQTFRADGTETPATAIVRRVSCGDLARPRVLALITTKGNQNIALITYKVSSDGQTLTARTSGVVDQALKFTRR
jgi:hypothetical protein